MRRLLLFQAGVVAAFIQCIAVGMVTIAMLLAVQHDLIVLEPPHIGANFKSELDALLPLLRWIYLLIAVGVALTSDRFVDFTAARIRLASRLMHPAETDHATKTLLVQLMLASIGLAVLVLRPPPDLLISAAGYLGCGWDASVAWSGMMSIAAAGFGANAQAARRALRASNRPRN
jgi:hypothetical protein